MPADVSPPMIDLEVASAADIKTALLKTANTLTDEKDTAQAALTAENNNIKTAAAAHDSAALQAALDRIQAKLPAGRTLPAIDLTTATEADIINQIKALIDTLPNTKTSAQTALNTAEPQIKAAADARDKGKKTAGNADSAESSARAESLLVGGAINAGYADGDAVAVPDLITANAEAKTKADAVKASVDDAEAKTKDAGKAERDTRTAIAALHNASVANRVSRAADALTRADAAVTAATGAVTSAASARQAARDAARSSRIAARSAEAAVDIGMFRARFPGVDGNLRLVVTARASQNLLSGSVGSPRLSQVKHRDLVLLTRASTNTLYIAESKNGVWLLVDGTTTVALNTLDPQNDTVRAITFSVQATGPGAFAQTMTWENLTVHSERRDGVLAVFGEEIPNRTQMLETPLVLRSTATPVDLAKGLLGSVGLSDIGSPSAAATGVTQILVLAGGNDGVRPTAVEYEGQGGDEDPIKSGLKSFEDLEEISILAAPGVSYGAGNGYRNEALQATQSLISHCERMRYRVAVLDSPDNQSLSQVRQSRAILDTTRAAIYYPWVRVQDPITREPINVPPSGFVAGIYARNDVEQGVHKAPANEVVIGAIGLETLLNTGQQDVLNPLGINCIRFFENRGIRVWGARTLSSDPEWKYLNIRRYFAYLERSIEKSTQWAVFEPNGDALWANVRRAVEDYLFNEWKSERLFGANPDAAFFVRCDRSTMTQNDLDNGRMICLIGVAPLYPAEFVIFRIGQWTADRPA